MRPANSNSEVQDLRPEPGYDYVKEIARGGYGYVYLFMRTATDARDYVAGKFVYRQSFGAVDHPGSGAAYDRAFEGLQNFRSLSGDSPYLLRLFDVRQRHDEGYFCYMMELADDIESGRTVHPSTYKPRTLKNELERGNERRRLPARRCVEIAITLARGLRLLHESGFTHRDVRPSNIIFVHDVPKLADIDLLAGSHPELASYIPRDYAAPEGSHSHQADIFSFGKTLYEMCTGLPVTAYPCLPPDIRLWDDHITLLGINRIIARACARDLNNRYRSAQQMLADFEQMQNG